MTIQFTISEKNPFKLHELGKWCQLRIELNRVSGS